MGERTPRSAGRSWHRRPCRRLPLPVGASRRWRAAGACAGPLPHLHDWRWQPRSFGRLDAVGWTHLQIVERAVAAAFAQQLVVRTAFDDAAVLDEEDEVGMHQRTEPMCDDERYALRR